MVRDMSLAEAFQAWCPWWSSSWTAIPACCICCRIDELVLCASNNPQPETIGQVRLKLGEGLTGWVARERRLLSISREAYLDPRFKLFTRSAGGHL